MEWQSKQGDIIKYVGNVKASRPTGVDIASAYYSSVRFVKGEGRASDIIVIGFQKMGGGQWAVVDSPGHRTELIDRLTGKTRKIRTLMDVKASDASLIHVGKMWRGKKAPSAGRVEAANRYYERYGGEEFDTAGAGAVCFFDTKKRTLLAAVYFGFAKTMGDYDKNMFKLTEFAGGEQGFKCFGYPAIPQFGSMHVVLKKALLNHKGLEGYAGYAPDKDIIWRERSIAETFFSDGMKTSFYLRRREPKKDKDGRLIEKRDVFPFMDNGNVLQPGPWTWQKELTE